MIVRGAIDVLNLAKRLKCKIVQAFACDVYCDTDGDLQDKTYGAKVNPIEPVPDMMGTHLRRDSGV